MSTTEAAEIEAPASVAVGSWVATVGDAPDLLGAQSPGSMSAASTQGLCFRICAAPGHRLPPAARDRRWLAIVEGHLQNARELTTELGLPVTADAAAVVVSGLRRDGLERFVERLRGVFAVLVWDADRAQLAAVRDHIGIHPLYWVRSQRGVAFSTAVEPLLAEPGVRRDLNPVALAEYLSGRFATDPDTFYAAVHRCPPASITRADRSGVAWSRYWHPIPPGERVAWLTDREADGFDDVFARAVSRSIGRDRPAIFLSGGLDSIAVGAVAADLQRRAGAHGPLALSLGFEEPDCDERQVQRRVAADLGLEQQLLPFSQAVPQERFVRTAVRMGADWPFPMWNVWSPAYAALAGAARARGCGLVLTGRGGDEWLTVSPYYAADLARNGDLPGLVHLLRSHNRSRRHTGVRYSWHLLADRVARPLASAALDAVAPAWWHRRRRARMKARLDTWIAPHPQLQAALEARVDRFIGDPRPAEGFYAREMLATLVHPCVTGDLEETYEFGRRVGVRQAHPYWDVDVVEFLCRMPPRLLDAGARSKAPLRRMLARRFPGLGFERQKKAHASRFFASLMCREAPALWRELGGLRSLHALGVVDAAGAERELMSTAGSSRPWNYGRVLELLTLETWARHRVH